MTNYYEILQVSQNADPEVIEAAYKRLAKKHHPDVGGDPETMKLINEAYAVLKNPADRIAYDSVYFAQTEAAAEAAAETYTEEEIQAAIFAELARPRPWARLIARYVDLTIWILVVVLATEWLIPYSFWYLIDVIGVRSDLVLSIIIVALWIPVEAALVSKFGATPGKQLLRIRVVGGNGSTLSYINALKRSAGVFGWGLGLGIPILSLVCMYVSYSSLKTFGFAKWDASAESIVLHGYLSLARIIAIVLAVVGLFWLAYWP